MSDDEGQVVCWNKRLMNLSIFLDNGTSVIDGAYLQFCKHFSNSDHGLGHGWVVSENGAD